jgi:predicted PurR-regulated permease PerM
MVRGHDKARQQQGDPPGTWTRGGDVTLSATHTRASLVAIGLLFLAGVYTVHEFLPALVWAVIIAIGVWPAYRRMSARWPQHRRELIPGIIIVALLLVFVLPLTLIAVPVVQDAQGAAQWVEHARQTGIPAPPLLQQLPFGAKLTGFWQNNLSQPGDVSNLTARVLKGSLLVTARHFGVAALHRLVLLGFMLLALFFLLREGDDVVTQVRVASRRAFGDAGENVGRQMVLAVNGAINGLVLVGLAEGVLLGIAYFIVGVPHAMLFAVMTALLAMVPFGAPVAFLVSALFLLATGKVIGAIVVVVLGSLIGFIADHFVRPVLIGGATRLPFVWVLLGILGGVGAWGLMGLILGPAILAALILLWREWVGSEKGPINPLPVDV